MTMRHYLSICYLITLALLLTAGLFLSADKESLSFVGWLVIAPMVAATNVLQIWYLARLVPEDRRTGFWSYKWPSIIFIAVPGSAIALGLAISAGAALTGN